jgi:hypothetical protein
MKLKFVSPISKSWGNTDVVEAPFVDLAPQKRIGLSIKFLSEGPQCARIMMIVCLLGTMSNGTLVAIVADDVPSDALCGSTT